MFKWLKRRLLALLCSAVLSAIVGAVYEQAADARDAKRFHTPGRLVDIGGGRKMSLDCRGAGLPAVILETGLGGLGITWKDVMKGVEPLTRVCSYDRAGYGYSDAGPLPRTSNLIAEDLEKLLAAANEKGPYILVGHSFGGMNIRVFNARNKQDVAGLIFVDSSHPEQFNRFPASVRRKQNIVNWVLRGVLPLNRIGVVRAALAWTSNYDDELTFRVTQPKFGQAYMSELDSLLESGRQTSAASPTLGDQPIIVLTAGKDGTGTPELYKMWREEFQPELVRMSTRSKQYVVEGSTHLIPIEKPQAVVDAIREMLAGIKQS